MAPPFQGPPSPHQSPVFYFKKDYPFTLWLINSISFPNPTSPPPPRSRRQTQSPHFPSIFIPLKPLFCKTFPIHKDRIYLALILCSIKRSSLRAIQSHSLYPHQLLFFPITLSNVSIFKRVILVLAVYYLCIMYDFLFIMLFFLLTNGLNPLGPAYSCGDRVPLFLIASIPRAQFYK